MKHAWNITLLLLAVFLVAQVIGLAIIYQYTDVAALKKRELAWSALPLNIERPELDERTSFTYIFGAILIGTLLFLLLIKFRAALFLKLWFLLAVFLTLTVAFGAFIPELHAMILAIILAGVKIFKPNILVHNFTELFIYGGLAAIFVPVLNLFSVVILLLLISAYDMYAVWKSKHMITLAKFQTEMKVFAGLFIPYKKKTGKIEMHMPVRGKLEKGAIKSAVLGGGDIGFPLLFAGVVLKQNLLQHAPVQAVLFTGIISLTATLALFYLLVKAQENRFYPAMPILSVGCLLGYGIVSLLSL